MMKRKIVDVHPHPNYTLQLSFYDGTHGVLDLSGVVHERKFTALQDYASFQQVMIDDLGGLYRNNAGDIAGDRCYAHVQTT